VTSGSFLSLSWWSFNPERAEPGSISLSGGIGADLLRRVRFFSAVYSLQSPSAWVVYTSGFLGLCLIVSFSLYSPRSLDWLQEISSFERAYFDVFLLFFSVIWTASCSVV